jgi:hypothetical protein
VRRRRRHRRRVGRRRHAAGRRRPRGPAEIAATRLDAGARGRRCTPRDVSSRTRTHLRLTRGQPARRRDHRRRHRRNSVSC